jgi:hypothetical protein
MYVIIVDIGVEFGAALEKFSHRCSRRSETWSALGVHASTAKPREACICSELTIPAVAQLRRSLK